MRIVTEKDVLKSMGNGPTLQELVERISQEFSEEVSPRSVGDILVALQDKGYVFLDEGRWWRTPEGVHYLERILAQEAAKAEQPRVAIRKKRPLQVRREVSLTRRDMLAILILVATSLALFSLSGYVDQVSLHDDKAYLNNALIHSGRLDKDEVLGPYSDERPPLFWWMLTTLFLFNAPVWSAKYLSPFFGVVLVIVTYLFARKMFNSVRLGFYSGLFLTSNAFMLSTVGSVLSDVPGTALSTLLLFCLYVGLKEKRDSYLLATGPLAAWALMMRDQNLILLPIALFYLCTRLESNRYLKTLIAFAGSLSLGVPVVVYGLIGTLTALSSVLTPVVLGGAQSTPLTAVGLAPAFVLSIVVLCLAAGIYFSSEKSRQMTGLTLTLSALLFFITIYPYLWDNYVLGATFEIEGKGIFSRLISHQIMSETIGVGANLSATTRRVWWLSTAPLLVSPLLIVFSAVGLVQMLRKKMYSELALLFPWLAFTSAFTVLFTYLEVRFLFPSLPVLAIVSSKGFLETLDWIRSQVLLPEYMTEEQMRKIGATLECSLVLMTSLTLNLVLTGLDLPGGVGSFAIIALASASLRRPVGWFSDYLTYLEGRISGPRLNLDPMYILESLACLAVVVYICQREVRLARKLRHALSRFRSTRSSVSG